MATRFSIALLLTLAVLPAQAQVYKWVDDKGKVNYSNTPPPSVAGKAQVVEEQISIMGMDPAVRAVAERRFAYREYQEELDWQQRQRALAMQPASGGYDSYGGSYYPASYNGGYYGGYYTGHYRRPFISRPIFYAPPRVMHHSPRSASRSRGFARR